MRKFTKLLAILAIASAMTFAACGTPSQNTGSGDSGNSDVPPVEDPAEITLTLPETASVGLFGSLRLEAETDSLEDVTYSSSDADVLTIGEFSGIITPQAIGSAVVTATVEQKTATCTVTVTAPGDDETLEVSVNKRKVELTVGGTEQLSAEAYYNDAALEQTVTYTYSSSNEDVATVSESGLITAVSKGSANITINGTCKGYSLTAATVKVEVSETVVLTSGIEGDALALCTKAQGDVLAEKALAPTVTVNGESVSEAQFTFTSSNEAVAKVEEGVIKAVGKGSATVTVSYSTESGTTASVEISVTVTLPAVSKALNPAVVGLNDGCSLEVEGVTLSSITSATIGEEECSCSLESGKIVVSLEGVKAGLTAQTLTVVADGSTEQDGLATYTLTVDLTVYDFLIDSKADFTAFLNSLNATDYIYAKLTDNVDMENTAVETANNKSDCSGDRIITAFSLDGSGYTVSNMNATNLRGVIAGKVGRDSVIKNIAFNEVNAISANAGGMFMTVTSISFENVYISISANYNWGGTVALWSYENVSYKNVVVNCTSVADPNRTNTGFNRPVGALTSEGMCNAQKNYTDTYAINPVASKMIRGTGELKDSGEFYTTDDWIEDNATAYTEGLYSSWEAFAQEITSLPESFDSNIWTINDYGELVFKTMPEKVKPVFTSKPLIEGAENLNIFGAVNSENTIEWSETENAYILTNNVTDQNDQRGFYLNFDFMAALRERGAKAITFKFESKNSNETYISYTNNEIGGGWWNNRPTGWAHNSMSSGEHEFTMNFDEIDEGLSIFFLNARTGSTLTIKNFTVDYTSAVTATTTIDCSAETLSVGQTNIDGSGCKKSEYVTEGMPEGATGSCLKTSNNQYWGNTVTLLNPIEYTEKTCYISVRVYAEAETQMRFYTPGWSSPASEYSADKFVTVPAGEWFDVILFAQNYVVDGKIQKFIFVDFTGSEIYIDSISILALPEVAE